MKDIHADPDRIRRPLKRIEDDWVEITWDQAFSEIGAKTRALMAEDPNCTSLFRGNPNVHSYANILSFKPLLDALGTPQNFGASTVDQMPMHVTCYRMLGHTDLFGVPDIDRAQTLIVLGGNPVASNGSLWTVPDFRNRVKQLKARGGKLIVIDPRRTETAKIADQHLFIRPSSDLFFLIALLQEVDKQQPVSPPHHLAKGLDRTMAAVARFDGAACAASCGVAQSDIAALAKELCAGSASLYGRMGISVQENGTLNTWLIHVINIASGNYDKAGGIVFPTPAVDGIHAPSRTVGKKHSRVSGYPDAADEFPAIAMAEEIETPGPGQIKALFIVAGNPTLSVPNGRRIAKAMEQLELMVVVDMYRNATSRLAHYILPPASPLERDHYGLVLLGSAIRNFAKYSEPMVEPEPETLQDWQIVRGLAEAISGDSMKAPPPSMILDHLLKAGPYQISLEELKKHPSGMDFGPCQEDHLHERIQTEDGKINCAPEDFLTLLEQIEIPNACSDDG